MFERASRRLRGVIERSHFTFPLIRFVWISLNDWHWHRMIPGESAAGQPSAEQSNNNKRWRWWRRDEQASGDWDLELYQHRPTKAHNWLEWKNDMGIELVVLCCLLDRSVLEVWSLELEWKSSGGGMTDRRPGGKSDALSSSIQFCPFVLSCAALLDWLG